MDDLTPEQRLPQCQLNTGVFAFYSLHILPALWHKGVRYRKNYKQLIGKPDIVLTKYRIAIFCDSDYWHGYDWENRNKRIKSNRDYWIPKIERNMERDKEVSAELESDGWRVIRLWEWQIKKHLDECVDMVMQAISERSEI